MEYSWAISNPERWYCESAALNMAENLENSVVATGLQNVSFHSNPKQRQCQRMLKQLHSSHMLAKSCSKFSKPVFNSMWTVNFQMFKLDFKKAEELGIKLPTSIGSLKKKEFQKNIYFCFIDYAKACLCGSPQTVDNSSPDGNTRPPDLPLEKSVCRSGSNN